MEPIMSKPIYVARKINDLKDMLEQSVALYSEKNAFIKKNKENYVGISYKKYKDDVFGLGTELLKLGVKDEKIVILSENRYEWCVSFMSIVCSQGLVVPISTEMSNEQIISMINKIGPKIIIFSEQYRELVNIFKREKTTLEYYIDMDTIIEDKENLAFLRLIEDGNKSIQNGNDDLLKLEIDNKKDSAIFFGDTIVKENGVILSHKNICSCIMGILSFLPITDKEKVTIILSITNPFQCICNFLTILAQGGTVSFYDNLDKIKDSKPTICFLDNNLLEKLNEIIWNNVGTMPNVRKIKILMLLSSILTKLNIDIRGKLFKKILSPLGNMLKTIVVVGNDFNYKVLKEFSTWGIKVIEGYELLEASTLIMVNKKREFARENVMGLPLPGLKACILNSNGRVPGEITLKGNFLMKGYYNNKKDTDRVIKDGILYTGIIGYRDKNGRFYFSRNKKK